MSAVPLISRLDVAQELGRYYAVRRDHHLFAFYGAAAGDLGDGLVEVARGVSVRVVPVACELELRRRMLELGDGDRVAFLVPWLGSVPLDLSGDFARQGTVERIGPEVRVRRLFGVREVDDDLWQHPVVELLASRHGDATLPVSGGRLTEPGLWGAYLRTFGLERGDELALDVLLSWAASDGRGPGVAAELAGELGARVLEALRGFAGRQLGVLGPAVVDAWLGGRGRVLLELAIVCEALAPFAAEGPWMWLRRVLDEEIPGLRGTSGAEARAAAAAVGGAAGWALRDLEQRSGRSGRAAVRALVDGADRRLSYEEVRTAASGSTRLPAGWQARLDGLGEVLTEAASALTPAQLGAAAAAFHDLARHQRFTDGDQTATVERAEMAVRLLGWLVARPDRAIARGHASYAEVEALASWYAAEGGFVDMARRRARGAAEGALGRGVASVVAAADEARDALDQAFAAALPDWLGASRPASQVVPIDQALARFAVPFLAEEADRRLLVILFDGMSWTEATELLLALGDDLASWGPLAFHGTRTGRAAAAPYPPIVAGLPTITEVSRSAFFAGTPDGGRGGRTAGDPDRFAARRDLVPFVPEREVPRLLLRDQAQTRDGSASPAALALVGDVRHRIVAVVLNAIDMSLAADTAERRRWTVDSVRPLRALLEAARQAGRAVLLASDHGNVPSHRFQPAGTGTGARWRQLPPGDDRVAPHEVRLEGSAVAVPRGAAAVVCLTGERHRYGSGTGAGEHGGATLAEVVAPFVLVGSEDASEATADPARAVRPAHVPAWWHFDISAAAAPLTSPRRRRPPEQQLVLPAIDEPEAPGGFESALLASAVLRAREKDTGARARVAKAAAYLAERSGRASIEAFAAHTGQFVQRVAGYVSVLKEVLNVDGYEIIWLDRAAGEVRLDLEKLCQQFEVSP